MQTNAQLQDKQKTISQLSTELQSFKDILSQREMEINKYKIVIKEQSASLDTIEKLHQDEIQVKETIIEKLRKDMEKLEDDCAKLSHKQPDVVRDFTREKELVIIFLILGRRI